MINEIVDKVYVINTKSAVLRMSEVKIELERNNILFERVEAIPLDKVVLPSEENKGLNWDKWGWNECAVSLLETTCKIIEDAKSKNYKRILIFEDDAYINDENLNLVLPGIKQLIENEKEWHFIHLNYSNTNSFKFTNYQYINRLNKGCLCCQAYFINHQIYDIYLDKLKEKKKPIDETTRELHTFYKKSFVPSIIPVDHIKNKYSTIRGKEVPY
jgi:GR25 family glycosyltransferase involved in LPS biosynthesis